MLALVGTVPDVEFDLLAGEARLDGASIVVEGRQTSVERGTPALIAAAIQAGGVLGLPLPFAYLVGDIGRGDGSRRLYEHLTTDLGGRDFSTLAFHYLQPDADWHNRVLFAIDEMARRPILIADAGFMYAAKMSGQAKAYDLFTPDVGELAFLADEKAPHPFYTRGFVLHEENRVPDLIARAYEHDNAPKTLLVKGARDYVAHAGGVLAAVDEPSVPALEAIGGTGDTLTGMVAALIESGMDVGAAAYLAARANRLAGALADPTPATQVSGIIGHIPEALTRVLAEERGDEQTAG
jgi:hypothetical protein